MFKKLTTLFLALLLLASCAPEAVLPTRPPDSAPPVAGGTESVGGDRPQGRHLTITMEEDELSIYNYIDGFIALHPDVTIKINPPSGENNVDRAIALAAELMGGGGDDLIMASFVPNETYARLGMLENLYEYMDDEMRSDFYPKILESMEVDGGLYVLPKSVVLPTYQLTGSPYDARVNELLGDKTTLNYREAIEIFDEVRRDAPRLRYPGSYMCANLLANTELPLFYDYTTGYVSFGDTFISMTEKIAPYAINFSNPPSQGEYLFSMFFGIEDITHIPTIFPSTTNKRAWRVVDCNGNPVVWASSGRYAINANSSNKELAWEFLKFLSSNEGATAAWDTTLPARKSVLYGAVLNNAVLFGLSTAKEAKAAADYVDALLEHDFTGYADSDPFCYDMIETAYDDYNDGILTAEQLAARLQEKLTLYVNQ